MRAYKFVALALLALVAACGSTTYGRENWTGGFNETELRSGVWRVMFSGNGFTTRETVQTFWLFRCAELTLAKGYDGFSVVSPVQLVRLSPVNDGEARLIQAQYNFPPDNTKPWMTADIEMVRKPLDLSKRNTFDAAKLKTVLNPYVNGEKCNGNVCPHLHSYLYSGADAQTQ